MNNKLYLAYGSNMHLAQMAYRCPDARVVCVGVLRDYRLAFWAAFTNGGVATVIPEAGRDVPCVLWDLPEAAERALDRYEGFPSLYRKETVDVETADGVRAAMVYIMNRGFPAAPSVPYLQTILEGCRQNGIDPVEVRRALAELPPEKPEPRKARQQPLGRRR